MSDQPEGLTPSDAHDISAFRRDDRKHNVGRDGRSSQRVTRYVEDNPILSLIITIVVSVVAMVGKDTLKPSLPQGASSVQIEAVLAKVELLASRTETVAGDVRSLKESDVIARVRRTEDLILRRDTVDEAKEKEQSDRRRQWEEWRKTIDAAVLELRKGK